MKSKFFLKVMLAEVRYRTRDVDKTYQGCELSGHPLKVFPFYIPHTACVPDMSSCRHVITRKHLAMQTGVVECLHMKVDVKTAEGTILSNISSDRLSGLHPFSPSQFVIGGGWVGRVESIRHDVRPSSPLEDGSRPVKCSALHLTEDDIVDILAWFVTLVWSQQVRGHALTLNSRTY